ncbi:MAG: hypothetical protein P4M09_13425 [Devosia sp.]|nr:hypothetical protein [Devosia sp.]
MARARDQFRQSDVSFWGIVALASGSVALLAANISALVPDNIFAALHATRLGGVTVNEMHTELSSIEDEQARLRAANGGIDARLQLSERDATKVGQRVAALEVSVPKLTEALNTHATLGLDSSLVTGAIGTPAQGFSKPAEASDSGPEVKVTQTPLLPAMNQAAWGSATGSAAAALQPMPAGLSSGAAMPAAGNGATQWAGDAIAALAVRPAATPRPDVIAEGAIPEAAATGQTPASSDIGPKPLAVASTPPQGQPNVKAIGIAIGTPVQPEGALAAWQGLAAKVGILLVGTSPLLAQDPAGSGGKVLVAGPITDVATAARLCGNIARAGITCTPMPYVGAPLAPAGESN